MTWEENKNAIRELWPNATIEPALAQLFVDRLSGLDQSVLAEAVREARIQSRYPTPELREILDAYHKVKRLSGDAWKPRDRERPLPPSPDVAPEVEQKTVRDIRYLLSNVQHTVEAVEALIERILDAMDKNLIGPAMTQRQLVPLQVLKLRLLGRAVHPAALPDAVRIWPELDTCPPEATEGHSGADCDTAGVIRHLEQMAS